MEITRFTSPSGGPDGAGPAARHVTDRAGGEQLSLLPSSELPVQFRLDEATRRRGLRHVAEIRQMLAERQATRDGSQRPRHLSRRRAA